jgi:hypothetical protein
MGVTSRTEETVDLQKPFSYEFDDKEWLTKLGLGALISLVPILNFAIAGYAVQLIRNVAAGVAEPLPNWDDLGGKWRDGLLLALAAFVYAIPVFVFLCLPLSLLITSGIVSTDDNLKGVATSLVAVGGVALLCFFGLLVLYALFLSIIRPIIMVVFSRDRTFASCFRFGEFMRILTTQPGPFFTTWAVIVLAGLAVSIMVGFVTLVIGWVPLIGWLVSVILPVAAAMYLVAADGHILGQFRKVAVDSEPPTEHIEVAPANP